MVSVNPLIGMLAKDWGSVEPTLKNKPGYWYTAFSQNAIKAAISLPAYDTTGGNKIRCSVLLNVSSSNNEVTAVSMNTVDSLVHLSKEQSYSLQTAYYNNGFKPITDTIRTNPFYQDSTGFEPRISINEWLLKLNEGFDTPLIGISYTTSRLDLTIKSGKSQVGEFYSFEFDGYGQ